MNFRNVTVTVLLGATLTSALVFSQEPSFIEALARPFVRSLTVPTGEPKARAFTSNGKRYVTAIPGDSFASLAANLYGDETKWRLLFAANESVLPEAKNSNVLFKAGERSKVLVVPPASHVNPVYSLGLKSPRQIGEKEARVILEGMNLLNGKRSLAAAISGLKYGYTYTNKSGKLDDEARCYLFRECGLMKKALDRWGEHPVISAKATPALFEQWLAHSATKLTALPLNQRYALIKSLMTQETGQTHWVAYRPMMGAATDTGFGQFIPATAMATGINPYDPAQNLMGIAIYLNTLVKSHGLARALAVYNGGNTPPKQSFKYSAAILARMREFQA